MSNFISPDQIKLYRSIFLGREDIYAVRWEKNWRSWYMPAYDFDWNEFSTHRAQWWTIKDFWNKTLLPITDKVIYSHLLWSKTLWIYPLLKDNTSNFIVADFDKKNWLEECMSLIHCCEVYDIPVYLEKSRSWNGGHVWVFFEKSYPAIKSRKIFFELLKKSLNVSVFEKEFSFDRLFPNQDYLTWKWFGNLIALPFQWESLKKNNSCFLDTENNTIVEDRWDFLEEIQRISIKDLDELYTLFTNDSNESQLRTDKNIDTSIFNIVLQNKIILKRSQLTPILIKFLRENLNFFNSWYIVKKRLGKSTYKTEKYFKLIEENDSDISIPRWFLKQLIGFCDENNIKYILVNKKNKLNEVEYNSSIELYDYQENVLMEINGEDWGVIVAPPWAGKTIIGLEIINRKRQPALIIVHRRELYEQWIERIQSFLWIMKKDIWQIGNGKCKIGKSGITIAMMQSIVKKDLSEIKNQFGLIIIDECHHIPAKTFREAIVKFNSYYIYGFTATPKRKNNDEKLIYCHIWDIIASIEQNYKKEIWWKNNIIIRETNLFVPFDYKIDKYEMISKVLVYDTVRNNMIVEDIIKEIWKKRKIIVLTERKEHVLLLNLYLKNQFEIITLTWDDGIWKRKLKFQQIKWWNFQVLIATWQLMGEWIDIWELDCLFLVYPFSFEGKLIQYIWRIQRTKKEQTIYDYHDKNIDYFDKLFKKRAVSYRKLQKSWMYKIKN